MNTILLQVRLQPQEIEKILREFPQYHFLAFNEISYKKLTSEHWQKIEIIFGNHLNLNELGLATHLRWIHSPTPHLPHLCLDSIQKKGNILISTTKEENIQQNAEFAFSGILAFAKNLFHWKDVNKFPNLLWDSKWRDSMWTLQNKTLLQIGLGQVGTEITKRAREWEMKTWGVDAKQNFHPHCQKVFTYADLPQILPQADIICLNLPRTKDFENFFTLIALKRIKDDSILIVSGSHKTINENDLYAVATEGKFRGILFDIFYENPVPPSSLLWKIPNLIMTPEVSPRPKTNKLQSVSVFKYNLRQYISGNYKDMRNIVEL